MSLNKVALLATLHCLAGCAIGEVLGMVIGTALGLSNGATIALAVGLAFVSGFALTMRPLLSAGFGLRRALGLAVAADAASIGLMEIVDNALMLAIPGAMDAHLHDPLFWGSMSVALIVAGAAAFPLNRWLIARGQGHAVVHALHEGHGPEVAHEDVTAAGGHAGHGDEHAMHGAEHPGHGAAHAGHGSGHAGHGAAHGGMPQRPACCAGQAPV